MGAGRPQGVPTIMHVVRPTMGGMRVHLEALVKHLDRGRWRQLVVGPVDPQWQERLRQLGAAGVVPLPIADRLQPLQDLRAVRDLRRLVARVRPAVLHCHGAKAALVGRLGRQGAPVVYTVHGEPSRPAQSPVAGVARRLAERLLARSTQRFIAVSAAIASELEAAWGVAPQRVSVMHNGVDAHRFQLDVDERRAARRRVRSRLDIPCGALLLGAVARLAPEKGLDILVEALAGLRADGDMERSVMLAVAGEGPERSRLEALARAHGIEDSVRLPGFETDIPAFLAAIDVFVLPSRSEGQSIALLEAMAAGLPVVATRVGGIPEVVSSGTNGVLVAADDPVGLHSALRRVLGPEGRKLGRSAQRHVAERFSWSSVARRLEELYEGLLP